MFLDYNYYCIEKKRKAKNQVYSCCFALKNNFKTAGDPNATFWQMRRLHIAKQFYFELLKVLISIRTLYFEFV